ncbi:MAG TPA: NAD(P)/FAD-dependent oxidoreductase [Chromatiales bacterium]|nr:NAD(P)/FAD-dependent oxidoreductase [Thiotrichales bacterium]HIP67091.1 NAD(P)/FAD-dependent oxidoreductase [Chromatiales bacterium]
MSKSTYDILIIGGGPAGSSLAWALRDSGLNIATMDKQVFPRQKVCAGWVTPAVMQELEIDLADYSQHRVLQPITGFKISQLGQQQLRSHYAGEPVSYGIRRIEFDDYLLQRCGAEILPAQAFKDMQKTDEGWSVNGQIKTRLVVGAGGHFCPVARAIGSKGISELAVAAKEIEFEMTPEQKAACTIEAEIPELFFTPDLLGYGWVFRKGDYLNIGLGREDKHKLSSHVENFCAYLIKQGKIPAGTPQKLQGHAYLLYNHSRRKVIDENVLLIGDSAGLAYPKSGEGIRPAVESALLAAETIKNCHSEYSKAKLADYVTRLEQRFGERQPKPDIMEKLPLGLKKLFASRLMQTQWFTKNIVTDKWFLQTHVPPLLSQ